MTSIKERLESCCWEVYSCLSSLCYLPGIKFESPLTGRGDDFLEVENIFLLSKIFHSLFILFILWHICLNKFLPNLLFYLEILYQFILDGLRKNILEFSFRTSMEDELSWCDFDRVNVFGWNFSDYFIPYELPRWQFRYSNLLQLPFDSDDLIQNTLTCLNEKKSLTYHALFNKNCSLFSLFHLETVY